MSQTQQVHIVDEINQVTSKLSFIEDTLCMSSGGQYDLMPASSHGLYCIINECTTSLEQIKQRVKKGELA